MIGFWLSHVSFFCGQFRNSLPFFWKMSVIISPEREALKSSISGWVRSMVSSRA